MVQRVMHEAPTSYIRRTGASVLALLLLILFPGKVHPGKQQGMAEIFGCLASMSDNSGFLASN